MLQRYAVAFGAGCAAAFLFAVSAEASALAMTLAYLAPLPIMIATMGWGLDAGAIAAAASVAGLTLIAEPLSGMLFAASVALPGLAARGLRRHAPRPLSARRVSASQLRLSFDRRDRDARRDHRHARRGGGADDGHRRSITATPRARRR